MKNIFKNPVAYAALITAVCASTAFAATSRQSLASSTAGIGSKNFCTVLSSQVSKLDAAIGNESSKLTAQFNQRNSKLVADRTTSDATLAQNRAKWAKDRQAVYTRLTNKSSTDAEKQSVLAFQSAIEAAVAAREASIDGARAAYRQGIDGILSTRSTSIAGILTTFKSAIDAAASQAQSSCTAGTAPATVRETFQAAVKAAREARQTSTKGLDSVGDQVKTLAQTRNAAIQQALSAYETAQQNAVAALKAAFAVQSTSPATPAPSSATSTQQ